LAARFHLAEYTGRISILPPRLRKARRLRRVGTVAMKVRFKKTAMRSKKVGVHFKILAMDFIFEALLFKIGPVLFISRPILFEIEAVLFVFWPILFAKKGVRSRQILHAFGESGHSSCAEGGGGETMRRWNAARLEGNIASAVDKCRLWTSTLSIKFTPRPPKTASPRSEPGRDRCRRRRERFPATVRCP